MFTNLCLILLLLLVGSLQFRNFTFNYRKKAKKKSRKSVTALAQLYALYSHRARSFNQWQRALYPNLIITSFRFSFSLIRSIAQWHKHPTFKIFFADVMVVKPLPLDCRAGGRGFKPYRTEFYSNICIYWARIFIFQRTL